VGEAGLVGEGLAAPEVPVVAMLAGRPRGVAAVAILATARPAGPTTRQIPPVAWLPALWVSSCTVSARPSPSSAAAIAGVTMAAGRVASTPVMTSRSAALRRVIPHLRHVSSTPQGRSGGAITPRRHATCS
jgi:hypothetical protein